MTVKVKAGSVKERDGIALSVTFIANETVGVTLIKVGNKIVERPYSRFREDGKQIRTVDDTYFPPGDYKQMFRMAGGILGKRRRKAPIS